MNHQVHSLEALTQQPHTASGNAAKTWWAPMWRGLVADPSAKHYKAMRSAIWIYLYLLLHADRRTGLLQRRISTISAHTGIKPRTIQYGLWKLRCAGYISVHNSGRALTVLIQKWKSLPGRPQRRFSTRGQGEVESLSTLIRRRTLGGMEHPRSEPPKLTPVT
jgi:hypothetical protein